MIFILLENTMNKIKIYATTHNLNFDLLMTFIT